MCVFTAIHLFAQRDVATAKYMHATIDGNNTEWGSLNFYDNQTQLNFAIANDADNIYLCFIPGSEAAQMKLMRAGMKITISTKGKSKHEASIVYPLQQINQPGFKDSGVDKGNLPALGGQPVFNKATFRQNYISQHTTMQVSGFLNTVGEISTNNPDIHVAINWDALSNMVYEVAIAKKEFYGADYILKNTLADITLNVELNGLSHAEIGDAKNGTHSHSSGVHGGMEDGGNMGSGMHRGGGGMHGGGFSNGGRLPGGNEGGNMNNAGNISLNQKTSFKQKFVLKDGTNN